MVDLVTVAQTTQALYYGYKLTKELYDEYIKSSTVIFSGEKISLEFYLVIKFKREFQPTITELEDKLRKCITELNFDPRSNIIKIKRETREFEYILLYWMYVQQIPDIEMLYEEEEVDEEDIINGNLANDITLCLIPKISEIERELKGEALLLARNVLEEIGEKIQQNFNVLPWSIKLNILSNSKLVLKKLLIEIEKKMTMTSARYTEPEENIDGECVVNVWDVDAAFIESLAKVLFKKSILNRLRR